MERRIKNMMDQDIIVLKHPTQTDDIFEHLVNGEALSDGDYLLRKQISIYRWPCYNLLYYDFTVLTGAKTIVELGTREGVSADAFVRGLKTNGAGHLYTFDPEGELDISQQHFTPDFYEWCSFYQMKGEDGFELSELGDIKPDILYIDTDPHIYEQTKIWLSEYWIRRLKPGSYLLLDDVAPRHQKEVKVGGTYGILKAHLEWFDQYTDQLEWSIIVCAMKQNGCAISKFK